MDALTEKPESNKRASKDQLNEEESKPKKAKFYSLKQFRKQLHSPDKLNALKEFLSVLTSSSKHDYILDYLKNGGNCLELLQTLESDSTIPPPLVFDLVTQLLLGINAKYRQYYSSAHESCRYLINNYLPVIHKMLGLSSSKEERKVCLKVLTAMAALSSNLAKDVLHNVKFHTTNIELLTKHTGEKNSVRDYFVHFLTAFLVDSDSHTLSVLLEKSGMLSSIISGLQYDDADTVCIVIAAMKNHILENSSVMKTTKMHVFNTAVVKDIVNLYNWKGPLGLKALEKNNKTVFEVDKLAKSKVSECVHEFLLVLCTSHKFGVIFRDHMVGLGRKNMNGLMYTVLDSLDRPWEHSYASDLVIQICKSCPDLTKTMWAIVKPFLEPRLTEKWLNTMSFAKRLIEEMQPSCIEYCAKDLSPQQLAQAIGILVSPSPILKVLLVEIKSDESNSIKSHIMKLLRDMLEKINIYLRTIKNWFNPEDILKITQYLSNYVVRHYPNVQNLINDWQSLYVEQANENCQDAEKQEYLETILDILYLYKIIAPQILYNLTSGSIDIKDFLLQLSTNLGGNLDNIEALQIKIVSIFVDVDHSYFLPKTDIFGYIIPLLLRTYHKEKDKNIQTVLFKLLQYSGIFENNLHEINIWINGIFNVKTFTKSFADDLVEVFRKSTRNMLEYQEKFSQLNEGGALSVENQELIQSLVIVSENDDDYIGKMRHKHLSPMIFGLFQHCLENDCSKNLKKFIEFVLFNLFHNQTIPKRFARLIQENQNVVPSNVFNYINSWSEGECTFLNKPKGLLTTFTNISEIFLNSDLKSDVLKENPYPDFLGDVLKMSTFYFTHFVTNASISQSHVKNLVFLIQYIVENNAEILNDFCLELILGNPFLIKHFNIGRLGKNTSSEITTKAILELVEQIRKGAIPLDNYIVHYSNKAFRDICKSLKNLKKHAIQRETIEFLQVFPLSYSHCIKLGVEISHLLSDVFASNNYAVLDLLIYGLERVLMMCKKQQDLKPIDKNVVLKITSFLVVLNRDSKESSALSNILKQYFEFFPHNIEDIDKSLFTSILRLSEYNKDNADLAAFLLERNLNLMKEIEENISSVCDKKGLILPLVHILIQNNAPDSILECIYTHLETSILKAIQKPQKVGQHFAKNYNVASLIERFIPLDKCTSFADKVQKFEVAEAFHARLLEACYNKVITGSDVSEKQLNNIIMTFIHLEVAVFKRKIETEDEISKAKVLSEFFNNILDKIDTKNKENVLKIAVNDTFKTFCKFALKYGVSGQFILLTILRKLVKMMASDLKDDANVLLDMLLSHSEFLNVVLGEHSATKLEVLSLLLALSEKWNELMEKSHVAVVLSAYRGMITRCDRTVLALLRLYESKAEQTRFYDFKPFLWGRAAATHYSVRAQVGSSLTRQPKISAVLGILKEDLVNATVTNYPLNHGLHVDKEELFQDLQCYDLKFLLPLFSHILAPEQQVKTYMFIRSGALSLTVLGLASQDKEVRQAACHVLSRLYFHLEARQTGKDNLLWIRFVEALCKGVAVLPNFKLNSFSAIFFARMALILTNPKHLMYTPLSAYLRAKQELDLSTVPELYTLLFSSDVNYKEHRQFILEILRDGMKTEKDFLDFLKSMGYKLFSELFSSCLSDSECKLSILDILNVICKISLGVNILTENYSLLAQLSVMASNILNHTGDALSKFLQILLGIVKSRYDKYTNQIIFDICQNIFESSKFLLLGDKDLACYFEIMYTCFTNNPNIIKNYREFVDNLTLKVNDRFCNYMKCYGCNFISEKCADLEENSKMRFLRLLIYKLLM